MKNYNINHIVSHSLKANDKPDTWDFSKKTKNIPGILISNSLISVFFVLTLVIVSCKKGIQIPPPVNSITTATVFSDSTDATGAVVGIYSSMSNTYGSVSFDDGQITEFCGGSADEITTRTYIGDFYINDLIAPTASTSALWASAYQYMYQINACIEGIQGSTSLSAATKNQLTAECEFLRAFEYFYLVNLYGDVPLLLSSNYKVNENAPRTPVAKVNAQILTDLLDAQKKLPVDYSISGGQRVRANKMAATALLARAYLFAADWKDAEAQASIIINNSNYSLVPDLNQVFLANSNEAILQWSINSAFSPSYNATSEGYFWSGYPCLVNNILLNAFEAGDNRLTDWVDNTTNVGYPIPDKYKIGQNGGLEPNGPVTEYYMVLRLGEQIMIRAEAEAHGAGNGISGAINDLNMIRNRAGLQNYAGANTENAVLAAIYHENQVEFCFEWGHRWLDLKRTGQLDSVMKVVTPLKGGQQWRPTQALYPIPTQDIQLDHYLSQNPGY